MYQSSCSKLPLVPLISHTPWAEAVHKRFEPFLQGQTNYAMIIFEQWFKILSTNYQRNRASKTRVLNITSWHDSTILLVQSSKGPNCRTQGICVLGISRGRLIRTPDQHNHQQTKKTSKILLWVQKSSWALLYYLMPGTVLKCVSSCTNLHTTPNCGSIFITGSNSN